MLGYDTSFQFEPLDLSFIFDWVDLPMPLMIWELFRNGGWLVLFFIALYIVKEVWVAHRQAKYDAERKFVLLAIDVPRDSEQSPKAVENIFGHLSGPTPNPNFKEKYWDGETHDIFSFEIVSIDGYVQFLIRCDEPFRDIVESGFYAQYPNVEITEVEDYVNSVPLIFPDENYNMFGAELFTHRNNAYPIKTYVDFEHSLSQELKDPLSSLLENMSRLQVGEQLWVQILATPVIDSRWKDKCKLEIDRMLKKPIEIPRTWLEKIIFIPFDVIVFLGDRLFSTLLGPDESAETKKEDPFKVMNLTPGEKKVLESMEMKIAKLGYEVKFRFVYVARKEVFSKVRGVISVLGSMKQFNTVDLNSFRPHIPTVTKIQYFFKKTRVKSRQNKMMTAYKERSKTYGPPPFILNIEELASIYHLPDLNVKTPLLKRTSAKKAEPPTGLPVYFGDDIMGINRVRKASEKSKEQDEDIFTTDKPQLEEDTSDDNVFTEYYTEDDNVFLASVSEDFSKKASDIEEPSDIESEIYDSQKDEDSLQDAMLDYFSIDSDPNKLPFGENDFQKDDDSAQREIQKEMKRNKPSSGTKPFKKSSAPPDLPIG